MYHEFYVHPHWVIVAMFGDLLTLNTNQDSVSGGFGQMLVANMAVMTSHADQ